MRGMTIRVIKTKGKTVFWWDTYKKLGIDKKGFWFGVNIIPRRLGFAVDVEFLRE